MWQHASAVFRYCWLAQWFDTVAHPCRDHFIQTAVYAETYSFELSPFSWRIFVSPHRWIDLRFRVSICRASAGYHVSFRRMYCTDMRCRSSLDHQGEIYHGIREFYRAIPFSFMAKMSYTVQRMNITTAALTRFLHRHRRVTNFRDSTNSSARSFSLTMYIVHSLVVESKCSAVFFAALLSAVSRNSDGFAACPVLAYISRMSSFCALVIL
jgi:hypothetical protein